MRRAVTVRVGRLVAALVALAVVIALAYNSMHNEIEEARREGAASALASLGPNRSERDLLDLVADRALPPVAVRSIQPDGKLDFDIDGDGRITRTKVVARWDIDGDGMREPLSEFDLENEYAQLRAKP